MSCGAIPKVKLLSGRMRGQAFVEFDSRFMQRLEGRKGPMPFFLSHTGVESASRAIKLVNGYLFQDKPLVISYGHRRP